MDSPIGTLKLVAEGDALTAIYMEEHRHVPENADFGTHSESVFGPVKEQLTAYFAGQLQEFSLTLSLRGTDFQRRVWAELQKIPYGHTWSYGQLATRLGNPKASRAVGLANGRNPISIVIPCHRVIGANGSLTGYGGGLERKQTLLELERQVISPALF
ncbi:methylated-DNA--[protein]-cysteine S-methyltransferase [Natronoglycomyces albus]|uniref:Methylated-DNA--protein-cysteine methyltransferase n=2 Tax=Natronoglycomyces albus TaxID=2811108 RepID=A0A895XZS3_9ACTN|nr:methylated-DNA--[protein]-cysteine S-methyltransferase [Natronoglycomyces albus]